jgi:hypothetical protein
LIDIRVPSSVKVEPAAYVIRRTASLIFRFSEIEQPVGNVDFCLWNSDYMAVGGRRQDFVVKNDVTHLVVLSSVIIPMSWYAKKGSVFGEDLEDGRCDGRRRTGGEPGHGYRFSDIAVSRPCVSNAA